jgi:recombination DNA repair RAD52 pathway protein
MTTATRKTTTAPVNETERAEDTIKRLAEENLSLHEALDSQWRGPGYRRPLTVEQIGALMSDLNPNRVASRQVQGRSLSYVEAYDIKATLTRIFGFGGFSADVVESKIIDIRDGGRQGQYTSGDKAGQDKTPYVMAQATVRLTIHNIGPGGQDVTYTETAVGTNDGWTIGDVADNAIKSAASDALKRCATYLGTQFGLSLYNNGSRQDVVRVVLEPEQLELVNQFRAMQEAKRKAADEQVAHSLGGERVTKDDAIADTANVAPAES